MILMLDNYDSFTYNLVQEMAEISPAEIRVVRNDEATAEDLMALGPKAVVISPGPGGPEDAGVSMDLITAAADVPLFGICLGHQGLAAVHGGRVVRAAEPVHGKTSMIHHHGTGLFEDRSNPFEATRYHSLVVEKESVPELLEVTAWTDDGVIMGLRDRDRLHFGVQFHPESYLCGEGKQLLAKFLRVAGIGLRPEWNGRG